jgi:hypothetical protein
MRCPSCNIENERGVSVCVSCKAPFSAVRRRPRRRGDSAVDTPLSPEAEAHAREVLSLYRWCLYAMIPVIGLVMGPVVVYRAIRISRHACRDPRLAGSIPVGLALWVGLVSTVASWLGLTLMVLGWWLAG